MYTVMTLCVLCFLRATVVKKYKTFWVKIPGPIVSQANALSPATPLHAASEAVSTSYPVSYLSKPVSNYKLK